MMRKLPVFAILPPLLFFALAGLFFIGMQREDPENLPSARIGQGAPNVPLDPFEGAAFFDATQLRDGKLKLVNIWASWCAPCRTEHPNLTKLAEAGWEIYGVNYKDIPQNARGFLEELGDPYAAIGADPAGRVAIEWGAYGVPETFLVDGEGIIRARVAGPLVSSMIKTHLSDYIDPKILEE